MFIRRIVGQRALQCSADCWQGGFAGQVQGFPSADITPRVPRKKSTMAGSSTAFAGPLPLRADTRVNTDSAVQFGPLPRVPKRVARRSAVTAVASPPIQDSNVIPDSAADVYVPPKDGLLSESDRGLPLTYDMPAISAYWDERPLASSKRLAQVAGLFTPWLLKTAIDAQTGASDKNAGLRAAELRSILVKLGPCFIKLGQSLSVRPDLIGPDAMAELRELCDGVPSFDSAIAYKMIEEELGRPPSEIFSELTPEPIAAASLGQVYKGKLRTTGEEVAVKVQRPDMLRKVSLDLYCLQTVARTAIAIERRFTANETDYLGLLNEWAQGTYKELDYVNEANNSRKFASLIHPKLPDVYVPAVYDEFTSRKVLTMEWINGTKLSACSSEEIKKLVNKGVECFLLQLLSAGFFHSDPHSANVIRLDNGQLCIIDFGLMATIEKEEMDAMVSAIIHLANRDYKNVVQDFVALKFLPENEVDLDEVEKVIGKILDQALEGGGAKSINFQSLSDELARVTFDFPFRIPPAFALLLRALSVLEGIALIGDPQFKLIMEAFPFVSRLILTDRSPALREALTQVLYKDGKFSPTRLRVLLDSSQGIVNDGDAFVDFDTPAKNSSGVSKEAIDLLFSADGAVLREILTDEIAKGIDIVLRAGHDRLASSVRASIPQPVAGLMGLNPVREEGRSGLFPISPLRLAAPGQLYAVLPRLSAEEEAELNGIRDIVLWLTDGGVNTDVWRRLAPEVAPKSAILGRMVVGRLGEILSQRFFADVVRRGGEDVSGKRRVRYPGGTA